MQQSSSSGVLPTPDYRLAAAISGQGKDLLLLHGGSGSRNHWIRNIDALAAHHRVFALDLPGFGESPDVPAGIGPDDYLDLLEAAIDRLDLSGPGLALAGFSFGGVLAAALARRLGRRAKRVSLIGPAGYLLPKERRMDLRSLRGTNGDPEKIRAVARHNLAVQMLATPDAMTEETIDLHLDNMLSVRFNSHAISQRPTLLDDLAQVQCPVQILWGGRDRLAYPSIAARAELARRAQPSVVTAVVPDAGHWAQYENAPDTNRALLDFLGR